jgi:hypothetical protein
MQVTSTAAARCVPRENAPTSGLKLGAVAVLAALGDFLLFGHSPGLGGVLFAAAVEVAAVVASGAHLRPAAICALVGAATLAPLIEDANMLSIAIAAFGAGAVARSLQCAHRPAGQGATRAARWPRRTRLDWLAVADRARRRFSRAVLSG